MDRLVYFDLQMVLWHQIILINISIKLTIRSSQQLYSIVLDILQFIMFSHQFNYGSLMTTILKLYFYLVLSSRQCTRPSIKLLIFFTWKIVSAGLDSLLILCISLWNFSSQWVFPALYWIKDWAKICFCLWQNTNVFSRSCKMMLVITITTSNVLSSH